MLGRVEGLRPGRLSPWLVRWALPVVRVAVRLAHRPTLEGFDHLPRGAPYMLVANHSAGLGQAELASLVVLYTDAVKARGESLEDRPLAGFAHQFGFKVPLFGRLMRGLGAVPSTYEAAHDTLTRGVPLLVFPGGEYETLRPLWQAERVDFGGRKGFLRIARDAAVPIVPLGIRGSHYTAPVLLRAGWLATALVTPRLMGLKRWGISLFGALLAAAIALSSLAVGWKVLLVWLCLQSPLVFVAWIPWTITMRIGPPIPAAELAALDLDAAYRRVEGAVQALVTGPGPLHLKDSRLKPEDGGGP